jgi:peptide-methionine (S)-S-oxide reductase
MVRTALPVLAALACGLFGAGRAMATETAIFAGGCFWCMEEAFDKVAGVVATTSGYAGGTLADPTYEQVSAGGTGYVEAVRVQYDPGKVSYEQLLEAFWHNVDPFDQRGQFCDKGESYKSVIFTATPEQGRLAEATKQAIASRFAMPVATTIRPAGAFYPAEDYHQDFYETNPLHYRYYKWGCGRAQRLEELWGKPAS